MRSLTALALMVTALSLAAQNGAPVFRTTSELVRVDVQVLHTKSGAPAPELNPFDFRVFEQDTAQEIVQFSRDEFPLSVVLLFHLTYSVRGVLKHLAEGAKSALAHFKPNDEVAVMVYSGHTVLLDGLTTDRTHTVAAI